jgi:hypothetical protein
MAMRTSPAFDAELVGGNPDRIYQLPESIPPMMAGVVTTGVVTGMAVAATSPSSMQTRVADGRAYVEGAFIEVYGGGETVTHDAGQAQQRVDLVTIRLHRTNRTLTPHVIKGTAGSNNPPSPVNSSTIVDLPLANVTVPANATYIPGPTVDRRTYSSALSPATPTAADHAAPKSYVDNVGTASALGSTVMRRDGSGRSKVASPVDGTDIAIKSYVDNTRNVQNWQSFTTVENAALSTSGTTNLTMGTLALPSGWGAMDVELHCYFETGMTGATHWRYSTQVQANLGGTWTNVAAFSHFESVIRTSNTSGVWVYRGQTMLGRILSLNTSAALRFQYAFSDSGGVNSANLLYRSTRRGIRAICYRRL